MMNKRGMMWVPVFWELIVVLILTAIAMGVSKFFGGTVGWSVFIIGFLAAHYFKIV